MRADWAVKLVDGIVEEDVCDGWGTVAVMVWEMELEWHPLI